MTLKCKKMQFEEREQASEPDSDMAEIWLSRSAIWNNDD
jgi:hypothetical protein